MTIFGLLLSISFIKINSSTFLKKDYIKSHTRTEKIQIFLLPIKFNPHLSKIVMKIKISMDPTAFN